LIRHPQTPFLAQPSHYEFKLLGLVNAADQKMEGDGLTQAGHLIDKALAVHNLHVAGAQAMTEAQPTLAGFAGKLGWKHPRRRRCVMKESPGDF
jgi:hypothetical protein